MCPLWCDRSGRSQPFWKFIKLREFHQNDVQKSRIYWHQFDNDTSQTLNYIPGNIIYYPLEITEIHNINWMYPNKSCMSPFYIMHYYSPYCVHMHVARYWSVFIEQTIYRRICVKLLQFNFQFNLKCVFCHISTLFKTVHNKYMQYETHMTTQYDITQYIIHMAMGARKPLQAYDLHICYSIFISWYKGWMCAYKATLCIKI